MSHSTHLSHIVKGPTSSASTLKTVDLPVSYSALFRRDRGSILSKTSSKLSSMGSSYPRTISEMFLLEMAKHRKIHANKDISSSLATFQSINSRSLTTTDSESLRSSHEMLVSLEGLPCSASFTKKKYVPQVHRVLFNPRVTEWSAKSKPHLRQGEKHRRVCTSMPGHIIPIRKPKAENKDGQHSPPERRGYIKKPIDRIHRLCRGKNVERAVQDEKNATPVNRRHLREIRLQAEAAKSIVRNCQRCRETLKGVKLLIIGAGLSGISAAHRLLSRGFENVIVLEAQDRLGGRIHSLVDDTIPDHLLELGAPGLHHFETWNTVYNLAYNNNLIDGDEPASELGSTDVHVFHYSDHIISEINREKAMRYSRALEGSNGVVKQLNDNSQNVAIKLCYNDFIRERSRRLCRKMEAWSHEKRHISNMAFQLSCFVQDGLYRLGNKDGSIAVQHLDSDTRDTSCIMRLPRGMSSLFVPLLRYFKKDTIRFNSKVNKVDWSSINIQTVREGVEPMVKVSCENGRVFTAHHVIVTLPLGNLKKSASRLFKPSLSESKLQAIEKLGFGSVSKVFLHFLAPLWSKSFRFIWTDDIDGKDGDPCCRDSATIVAWEDNPVVQISTVGTYLEDVCDVYLKRLFTAVLSSYLQRDIPDPEKITRSYWSTNPLFGGTHPFMDKVSSKEDIRELASPVYFQETPIILFGGDATHDSYTCLTHAARASGLREAKRLEHFYNELYRHRNRNTSER